ncbi:uncharacterized protein LOC109420951 isoform X1 [Aedes albopictus]|uniref:N-acetyltransferase domain-containing protein n=1 Tax=Aedes albopictus TaxID=7160 RepID=A0ABM1ZFU1_AEDAL
MMLNSDELTPIAPRHWPELRDLFKVDWPRHEIAHSTVQNYINWNAIDPRIKQLEVLTLNDSWRQSGTYIIIDRYYMFIYTLEESKHTIHRVLLLIDWDYSYKISHVPESLRPILYKVFQMRSVELQITGRPTNLYKLPMEKCLTLDCTAPPGVTLHKLELHHATQINTVWPHRCEGSEYTLKRLIAWNPSMGLFDESGRLLAWSLCWTTGTLAALQVDAEHLRKGFGSLVVRAVAKEMTKVGMNCQAIVHCANEISNAMFTKLGFEVVGSCFVVRTKARKLVEYVHES